MNRDREFLFAASAVGAGGVLEQQQAGGSRRTLVIPSLASVALAPTGGEGTSVVTNYHSEVLSFSRAETRVAGHRLGGSSVYTTYTDVLITNLRVLDRLSVALMHATLSSTRDAAEEDDDHSMFTLQAMYRGVEYDGQEIAPVLDVDLCGCNNYGAMREVVGEALRGKRKEERLLDRFGVVDASTRKKLEERIAAGKAVQSSVVKEVRHGLELADSFGHRLFLPGLGTVCFGELMFKPGRRRLNLLRIAFGRNEAQELMAQSRAPEEAPLPQKQSPGQTASNEGVVKRSFMMKAGSGEESYDGSMTVGSGEGNGSPLYP